VEAGRQANFSLHVDGSLRFHSRLCVPNDSELKREIL